MNWFKRVNKESVTRNLAVFSLFVGASFFIVSCQEERRNVDHQRQIESLIETTSQALDSGAFDTGMAFFEAAYDSIPNKSIGDRVRRYSFLGQNYCLRLEEYNKGLKYLDSALVLLHSPELRKKYRREYASLFFNKGDLLFRQKKYNDAYQNYYKGKLIAKSILDPCAISEYANRLAMISYGQGKYKEAASHFKQCYAEAESCVKDFRGFAMKQSLLSNTSLSYGKCGMIDSAFIYSQKALNYIAQNGKLYPERKDFVATARAVVYGNLSDLYLVKGDTVKAEVLMKRSIAINSKKGFDNLDAQLTILKLANLHLQTAELTQIPALISVVSDFQEVDRSAKIQLGLSGLEAKYYEKVGDVERAYKSLQTNMLLKDSIAVEDKKLAVADVDKDFRGIEQDYKFDLVQKDLQLQQVYLYVAILFFVMTVLIIVLILRNGRISRRNLESLTNLNKHITFQNSLLEQTVADLQKSNQDKDRILKVVAHDLRNPIGAIVNISSILLNEVTFSPIHREFMEIIQKSSWNSIEMIKDLLEASLNKLPSELTFTSINCSELIRKSIEQLQFRADEKKQKIIVDGNDNVVFKGDQDKLVRVLNNLIINAIKFSPVGSVIEITTFAENDELVFSVKDYGIGIPESIGDKVFDMFTEAKRRGTEGEQPFGIGLSFSKQVVEAHGGEIWFESSASGSTFHVRLPIQKLTITESEESVVMG